MRIPRPLYDYSVILWHKDLLWVCTSLRQRQTTEKQMYTKSVSSRALSSFKFNVVLLQMTFYRCQDCLKNDRGSYKNKCRLLLELHHVKTKSEKSVYSCSKAASSGLLWDWTKQKDVPCISSLSEWFWFIQPVISMHTTLAACNHRQ